MDTFQKMNLDSCSSCEFKSTWHHACNYIYFNYISIQNHSANSLIGVTKILIPKSPEPGKCVEDIEHL